MSKVYDTVIIGAGASGLACAAALHMYSAEKPDILIIDVNKKAGRKLLATGNGRCNLSNENMSVKYYYGDVSEASSLLGRSAADEVNDFFRKLSLITTTDEEGRVYPISRQAQSVLSVLMTFLESKGAGFLYETEVTGVKHNKGLYEISTSSEVYKTRNLVLATGGKANPKLSSGRSGYDIAVSLGHSCTKLYPALTQLKTEDRFLSSLSGVRCRARISLMADRMKIAEETGELQIADKALSGICVFDLSSYASEFFTCGRIKNKPIKKPHTKLFADIDFMPDMSFEELLQYLVGKKKNLPEEKAGTFLDGVLNLKLSEKFMKVLNLDTESNLSELRTEDIVRICRSVKSTSLEITGTKSWDDAQVTGGGIPLNEISCTSMESGKNRGLYLCGELLNIHGRCGGYNLNFAWITALTAAKSIAEKSKSKNVKNK